MGNDKVDFETWKQFMGESIKVQQQLVRATMDTVLVGERQAQALAKIADALAEHNRQQQKAKSAFVFAAEEAYHFFNRKKAKTDANYDKHMEHSEIAQAIQRFKANFL